MKKKIIIGLTLAVLFIGTVSSVYGFSAVKLIINHKETQTDVIPRIIEGRLLVPVRVIAESLGAEVHWDEDNNSVNIEAKNSQLLEMQVQRLESALAPKDPLTAAKSWAEGVKMRNGALQYAVMSPELRKEKYAEFAENYWSTGTSSPWVKEYQIIEKGIEKSNPEAYLYQIAFTYTDSTGAESIIEENLRVRKFDNNWFIASMGAMP